MKAESRITKKRRHQLYKKALECHKKSYAITLCRCMRTVVTIREFNMLHGTDILMQLPEFGLFKPRNNRIFWFGSYDSDYQYKYVRDHQQVILKLCIEMSK